MSVEITSPSASVNSRFARIDHIAIAVKNLDVGIEFFSRTLGFELTARRTVTGQRTGMLSAEMCCNGMTFVLCQGIEPDSQVSRLIDNFGPGVAHIALAVDDVEALACDLANRGLEFDTTVIRGAGLKQIFSTRDENSGMSFELIERSGEAGFLDDNVHELFAQLEKSGAF